MKLNCGLSLFGKNQRTTSLKFSVSYEKETTKDSKVEQLIKTETKSNLTVNLLFETAQCVAFPFARCSFPNSFTQPTCKWLAVRQSFYHHFLFPHR